MPLHFPLTPKTMLPTAILSTPSFPPADDFLAYLKQVDYQKHFRNFINVVIICVCYLAAVVSTVVQRSARWYRNGGEIRIRKADQTCVKLVQDLYLWVRCVFYPEVLILWSEIKQTYRAWQDLVTV